MNIRLHSRPHWLIFFVATVLVLLLLNPIASIDIALLGIALLVVGHVFLQEKLLLAFILVRPTLDWWRDYTLVQYQDISLNLNAGLALLLLAWAPFFLLRYKKQIRKVPLFLLLTLLTVLMFASSFYSRSFVVSLIESIKFVDLALLFIMSFIAIKEHVFSKQELLYTIGLSAIFPILIASFQLISGDGIATFGIRGRIHGTLAHPNVFAFFILFLLFLFTQYSTIITSRFWKKRSTLRLIIFGFLSFLLLMTYTRAAYIGLMLFLIIIGILKYRKMLVGLIIGVLAFYAIFFPFNRFLTKQTDYNLQNISLIARITTRNEDADSFAWRQALIRETIPIIHRKQALGYGYGTFPIIWEENRGDSHLWDDSAEAHNDYLRLFLEIGAFGLAFYIVILTSLAYYIFSAYKKDKRHRDHHIYLLAWISVFIVVSFTDNMLHHTPVMWMMWTWFGAAMATEYKYVEAPNFLL